MFRDYNDIASEIEESLHDAIEDMREEGYTFMDGYDYDFDGNLDLSEDFYNPYEN